MTKKLALLLIFIFLCLLGVLLFYAPPLEVTCSDGYFVSNILPELIGFSLEGILFVGLFSLIQLYVDSKKNVKKYELVKSWVRDEILYYVYNIKRISSGENTLDIFGTYKADIDIYNNAHSFLKDANCEKEKMLKIAELSKETHGILSAMIPIIVDLEDKEKSLFVRIIEQMRKAAESVMPEEIDKSTYGVLMHCEYFLNKKVTSRR